ncbi:MAG: ABC transporter substrate-binding protein, partial [Opitutales bacterium]|nr:ABC transporter substrate-binding protein [Opitutales bacterium]
MNKIFSLKNIFFAAVALALSVPAISAVAAEKIRAGYLPTTGHAKFFVACEEGFFKEEGLDVELVEFSNSADGLAALRARKLDIAAFGTSAPLIHISRGADLRIIGGVMGEDAAIFTSAKNAGTLKTVADLKGKKIATVRLSSGDAILRGALADAGLDWKKDVRLFELKNPPAVQEAVRTGQVDAGITWGPYDIRAEQAGLFVAIRSRDLYPGHPCCRLAVNTASIRENPETWVKFLRAFLKAEKFALTHKDETVAHIQKYFEIDAETIRKGFYEGFLDQTTDPNLRGLETFWKTIRNSGFAQKDIDIAKVVNVELYRQALESLRKENPEEPFWRELQKIFEQRNRGKR